MLLLAPGDAFSPLLVCRRLGGRSGHLQYSLCEASSPSVVVLHKSAGVYLHEGLILWQQDLAALDLVHILLQGLPGDMLQRELAVHVVSSLAPARAGSGAGSAAAFWTAAWLRPAPACKLRGVEHTVAQLPARSTRRTCLQRPSAQRAPAPSACPPPACGAAHVKKPTLVCSIQAAAAGLTPRWLRGHRSSVCHRACCQGRAMQTPGRRV